MPVAKDVMDVVDGCDYTTVDQNSRKDVNAALRTLICNDISESCDKNSSDLSEQKELNAVFVPYSTNTLFYHNFSKYIARNVYESSKYAFCMLYRNMMRSNEVFFTLDVVATCK